MSYNNNTDNNTIGAYDTSDTAGTYSTTGTSGIYG